jgi:hypothetical protein
MSRQLSMPGEWKIAFVFEYLTNNSTFKNRIDGEKQKQVSESKSQP